MGVLGAGRGAGGLQQPLMPPSPGSSSLTYQVVLGEYDMAVNEGPEQRIPVARANIFVHPKWRSSCVACG